MAIDMIENNELHATSRLGSKRFIDDRYMNYTGTEDFYNLFGSRKRKKSKARQQVVDKYSSLSTDCASIQTSIERVTNDLETLVRRSGSKPKLEIREQIDETNVILGELKSMDIAQGCQKAQSAAQSQKTSSDTLALITSIGQSGIESAKADIKPTSGGVSGILGGLFGGTKSGTDESGLDAATSTDKSANTKKLLLYSGIAIGAIILVAVVVKMTRK
jgi:hypothetical protein